MDIQELAKKLHIKIPELIKLAEKVLRKENLSSATTINLSEEMTMEVAVREYRKNTPPKATLRKKADKNPPKPIKPKEVSPDLEQPEFKEPDKKTTTEKPPQKTTPSTPHFLNKKTATKEENFEDDAIPIKKDKQKKDRLGKDEFSNKANYLDIIAEESELESIPEKDETETLTETKDSPSKKPAFVPSFKKKKFKQKKKEKHIFNPRKKEITITSSLTAVQLASVIGKKVKNISKILKQLNQKEDKDSLIEPEAAQLIAEELGIELVLKKTKSITDLLTQKSSTENLQTRPPVVTIMGHVDHGKTSLLDCIRNSNIAVKEKGNITQHIGAYNVEVTGSNITFLDTPGHEAFSAMRARGSNITDIVILVVAVDDGIKPQTIEAIQHAQAAKVAIIVAITKCDKPEFNPKKIMEDLMQYNLIAEEYGGKITMLPVSSQTKEGINELLELIVLHASNMNLKTNFDSPAKGVVIESKVDKNKGNLVSLLVQSGTLKIGDYILVGKYHGKVRTLNDENDQKLKLVTPSLPVEMMGLSQIAPAGTSFQVIDEKLAKTVAEKIIFEEQQRIMKKTVASEEDFFQNQTGVKELILLLKVDVHGSIEAVRHLIEKIKNEQVQTKIILVGVGAINLSDVNLAVTTKATIVGFNVRAENVAKKLADSEKVLIQTFDVIYELLDSVRAMLSGMLTPIVEETLQGQAKVLETFYVKKVGQIAGCQVESGKIIKDSILKIIRDNVVIHQNKLTSLKHFKNDAKVVEEGNECGLNIQGYKNFKAGDTVECYQQTETHVEL